MGETLTQELAKFAYNLKYEDIPKPVVEKIKTCVLHGISIGLASYNLEFGRIAKRVIKANPSTIYGEATLLGDGTKAPIMDAAFATSVMFHGRVQEDTHGTTHTGTVCMPLAIAMAEKERKTGRELITTLVAAYEIAAAVGKNYTQHSTPKGFRASSIYGIFGAATVAGLMLNLTEEQLGHALGFASAFAFGTTQSFASGSMEWRFEVGVAARNGMLAALLAKEGAISAPIALEGNMGFYKAFTGKTEDLESITKNLGTVWETMNVTFKLFATCAFNQTQVLNSIGIAEENDIDPSKVKSIVVEMSTYEANYPGQKFWGPFKNHGQTLMSVPFCVSTSLLFRRCTFNDLVKFEDPQILNLVNRVQVVGKDEVPFLCSRITVEMDDGTRYFRKMDITEEFYSLDFQTDVDMIRRMADEIPIPIEQINELIEIVANLETAENVDQLIQKTIINR